MAQIGDQFRTGSIAPVSGDYEFVQHVDSCPCSPTEEEREIPLEKGERFPPCKSCETAVIWRLIRFA